MNRVSTYLNFMGRTEEAFNFYRSVFGTEFLGPISRLGDMPSDPTMMPLSEAEKDMVMHIELPILAGHVLMATDMLESQGHQLRTGNQMTINLELDDRAETERLFGELSEDGTDLFGLQDMPWGAYWGTCADRFGVRWMFNCVDEARKGQYRGLEVHREGGRCRGPLARTNRSPCRTTWRKGVRNPRPNARRVCPRRSVSGKNGDAGTQHCRSEVPLGDVRRRRVAAVRQAPAARWGTPDRYRDHWDPSAHPAQDATATNRAEGQGPIADLRASRPSGLPSAGQAEQTW